MFTIQLLIAARRFLLVCFMGLGQILSSTSLFFFVKKLYHHLYTL